MTAVSIAHLRIKLDDVEPQGPFCTPIGVPLQCRLTQQGEGGQSAAAAGRREADRQSMTDLWRKHRGMKRLAVTQCGLPQAATAFLMKEYRRYQLRQLLSSASIAFACDSSSSVQS
jgi:hypothetical protein